MCGRFATTLPNEAMAQLFDASPANDLPEVPNFNTCPTTQIHVIEPGEDRRKLRAMRWGFIPHWYDKPSGGPLLINARAETIAEKPAFREACRQRRCLIPCSGFYEWSKDEAGNRLPWYITRKDGAQMVFAGIWQDWGPEEARLRTCAMVTVAANAVMSRIHHRMPVILEPQHWGKWLGEEGHGAATLMQPAEEDVITFHRVRTEVNSNRASGPQLIEEIPPDAC
ncbi:Putative SOS response-associated peptidase YedK [Pelagimonas phthalicica]|uniref:Abasic site processing protein n=1 Tax=Pelagimonas phthalicica TaxID=1037362 RepID=A0A238JIJ6_9RHOB|nr:SOS response-associated peptidase [Pelagimonas phthalicica]TDS90035.1 putative SOS response-associated peptidase YedK [Pelagimonas phthalicica]SMX30203.1 Putative SOS response-associated peptidase YedK [Pelagimonas phthalicica]